MKLNYESHSDIVSSAIISGNIAENTVIPLLMKDPRTPLYKGHNFSQQVLYMHVVPPLTKGYPSNSDRIFLAEGVALLEGDYCMPNWSYFWNGVNAF